MKFQMTIQIKSLCRLLRGNSKKTDLRDTEKKELLPEEITTWPELREFLSPYFENSELDKALQNAISRYHRETPTIVTCIEPVLTRERWNIFKQRLEEIQKLNPKASPKLSFHGTVDTCIPSIIQQGFLVPDGVTHHSVNGSRFGRGIYSSPQIDIAAGYGEVILCAVASAKPNIWKNFQNGSADHPDRGYDSNVVGDGNFLVMFGSEQIIPLCVIHEIAFESHTTHDRKVSARKLKKTMKKRWKGMSNPERFLYQKCRNVESQSPVIVEAKEEEEDE